MGRLYDQMKMDLELKNFSPNTVRCYLHWMVQFVRHYDRSPVDMGEEEIRKWGYLLESSPYYMLWVRRLKPVRSSGWKFHTVKA